jgi:hypothetical protein
VDGTKLSSLHSIIMRNLSILTFVSVATLFLVACSGTAEKEQQATNQYEQAKETLAQREAKKPTNFLRVSVKDKRNLIGQTVIKGEITSKATVAAYTDIEVELRFYSKTGSLLEKDVEVIYEQINPGQTESFKTKYFAPKGTDSVAASILKAQVVVDK